VDARDPGLLARELLRRVVAERRDNLRPDQLDLLEEPRLALLLLVRQRVAVARRTALQRVRDVDVGTRQADSGEQLVQEFARLADERDALLVFVEGRRLPDEHQVGVRVAVPEDDLRPGLAEGAARAGRGFGPERIEHRRESLGARAAGSL